jgi:hypothetical protein
MRESLVSCLLVSSMYFSSDLARHDVHDDLLHNALATAAIPAQAGIHPHHFVIPAYAGIQRCLRGLLLG